MFNAQRQELFDVHTHRILLPVLAQALPRRLITILRISSIFGRCTRASKRVNQRHHLVRGHSLAALGICMAKRPHCLCWRCYPLCLVACDHSSLSRRHRHGTLVVLDIEMGWKYQFHVKNAHMIPIHRQAGPCGSTWYLGNILLYTTY